MLKRRAGLGYRQMASGYTVLVIECSVKTVMQAVSSLNNTVCVAMWSLVMYSNSFVIHYSVPTDAGWFYH